MKVSRILLISSLLLAAGHIHAQQLEEAEIPGNLIRLSGDGTGIAKFKQCDSCETIIASINKNTKTYVNGKEVYRSEGRVLPKGFVSIEFDKSSNVVTAIRYLK